MPDSIDIRPYKTGDAAGISEFMHRCYVKDRPYENRSHSPEYYAWRYGENHAGNPVVYVAEDNGRIVGMMAVVPKKLWLNGEEVIGAESGDTFMDPACKGKNVFMNMASQVFDAAHASGFQVIYGTPNPVSYDVVVRLFGYRELFQYRSWIRPLNFAGIVRSRLNLPLLPTLVGKPVDWMHRVVFPVSDHVSGFVLSEVSEARDDCDTMWNQARDMLKYSVVKDGAYVRWRFLQCPEDFRVFLIQKDKAAAGYVVFKPASIGCMTCVHVADLFYPSGSEESALWKAILMAARNLGADFVNTWIRLDDAFAVPMKKNGFIQRKKPFWLVMRGEHRSVEAYPYIKNARNWCFSQADTDNI